MSFMRATMTGKQRWLAIDGDNGITFVPAWELPYDEEELDTFNEEGNFPREISECYEGQVWEVTARVGYGVRSHAPGYMDRTDWNVYPTKHEALAAYREEKSLNE